MRVSLLMESSIKAEERYFLFLLKSNNKNLQIIKNCHKILSTNLWFKAHNYGYQLKSIKLVGMKFSSILCGFIENTFRKMCHVSSLTFCKEMISLKDGHNLNILKM